LSASKRPGYILPAMVPLSLLVAAGLEVAPAPAMAAVRAGAIGLVVVGIGALVAGAAGVSQSAEGVKVVTPALLVCAGIFLRLWGRGASIVARRQVWATVVVCAVFGPGLGAAIYGPLGAYAESRSARPIAEHIAPGARVVCFRTFRAGLPFYLRSPVLLV